MGLTCPSAAQRSWVNPIPSDLIPQMNKNMKKHFFEWLFKKQRSLSSPLHRTVFVIHFLFLHWSGERTTSWALPACQWISRFLCPPDHASPSQVTVRLSEHPHYVSCKPQAGAPHPSTCVHIQCLFFILTQNIVPSLLFRKNTTTTHSRCPWGWWHDHTFRCGRGACTKVRAPISEDTSYQHPKPCDGGGRRRGRWGRSCVTLQGGKPTLSQLPTERASIKPGLSGKAGLS